MEFILPDSVMNILSRLKTDGFSAFVAGGAVRDTIMGKTPHDYDIATSARPEEVKKLFRRTIDTGIKHGTVTVVHNKTGYEVTMITIAAATLNPDNFLTSFSEFSSVFSEEFTKKNLRIIDGFLF